mmetsp:Transcript_65635/g.137191  ORF Transcript_65635/g.137191 Transcript_65635/m.137191 type:complete len:443 (+) Transcript_65635:135-1463(+)|eukprot:CAMPEP_0206451180 /NCGR_PEP_ID=MMETSP0324_2-20121206/19177_1 /ASSEMBLY_ACC=CAM_ASM_000836 /TAXON_ID=2866 /ORGANISM="Crypthecodinium cohnii, Strain Seligo" /LENGTH=442 /DNA_ID=CAMNT_0053920991 /DNA_START=122 /DNA_END=1450 /DNA_ORIENTATION=+
MIWLPEEVGAHEERKVHRKNLAEGEAPGSAIWKLRLVAQAAVGLPEMGWSISEALFVPLLLKLRLPSHFLTVCWLFSPILGLFLHPIVGAKADLHGRRPFIVVFGLCAAFGLAVMPVCVHIPGGAGLAILAFGLADTGHDLLYTPTVAQMNDVFDAGTSEHRCAVISGFGKLFGLLCASFLESEYAFWLVAGVMAVASFAQLSVPREQMRPPPSPQAGDDRGRLRTPPGFYTVGALQFAGWISLMVYSFYFTGAWAQSLGQEPGTRGFSKAIQQATALLTAGSLWFTAAGAMLPKIVARCGGELEAMVGALVLMALGLGTFDPAEMPLLTSFSAVIVFPVAYQVVARVPYTWVERQPSFEEAVRGRLTGRLTLTLSAAQIVVAVSGGPVAAAAGGELAGSFRIWSFITLIAAGLGFMERVYSCRSVCVTVNEASLKDPLIII